MTQFEYISIAISMVMALGVARLLDTLGPALRRESRSWIHVGWILQKFITHLLWWWGMWTARDADWNLGLYTAELVAPVILFLQASALARPSDRSPGSWEARFFEIRIPFFLGNLVLAILAGGFVYYFGPGLPVAGMAFGIGTAVAGLVLRDPRAHLVIVALSFLGAMTSYGLAMFTL